MADELQEGTVQSAAGAKDTFADLVVHSTSRRAWLHTISRRISRGD
jgi:hypothetical protein